MSEPTVVPVDPVSHAAGAPADAAPVDARLRTALATLGVFVATGGTLLLGAHGLNRVVPHFSPLLAHGLACGLSFMVATLFAAHTHRARRRLERVVEAVAGERARCEAREDALRDQAAQFRRLVEQSPQAVIVHREGVLLYANEIASELLGRDAEQLIGGPLLRFVHPRDHDRVAQRLARLEDGEPTRDWQPYTMMRTDGEERLVEAASSFISYGGRDAIQTIMRDMTAARLAERQLRESEQRLRLLMSQLPALLWATDRDLIFTSSQGAGLSLFSLSPNELVGTPMPEFFGTPHAAEPVVRAHRRALAGRSVTFQFTWQAITFEVHLEPLRDAGGEVIGVLGLALDVSERSRLQAELAHQAFHDGLTGLPNRSLFRDRVEHALARAQAGREPGLAGARVAVLFVDLDEFKTVNDSLGHAAGDALLRHVASRLQQTLRPGDTVARLGGDEFGVLLEGLRASGDAVALVPRVLAAVRAPLELDGREVVVGASVGVAYAAGGETADELLRNADLAMYQAKGAGKSRHAVFEPAMHQSLVDRVELLADLRRALATHDGAELRLVFQPVVELATGQIRGVEALLRWHHPVRGLITPGEFIPLAEQSGLVAALGRWVLGAACRQLREWERHLPPERVPHMAVNISGRHLASGALLGDFGSALAESGVRADRLTVEITEGVLLERTEESLDVLHTLKALGVTIAIDDFGTGYSSLAYLRRFPVDVVKIDKAFIDGVAQDPGDAELVRAVLALCASLGLRAVAEGVEDAAQLDALRVLACDDAQGYLFARPLPPDQITGLLRAGQPLAPLAVAAAASPASAPGAGIPGVAAA